MKVINLDVSTLPAPEPFELIMQALVEMNEDQYLRVSHRKQPLLLYKPLVENNFDYHVQQGALEAFDIFIWHSSAKAPQELVIPAVASS
ncbi:MAG: DUF2249 domain-containing protein [Gammaproteobacteria bacterium]|nr:DUF2249 domain-containing protein [Gammaproteobacteria bacterium]